MDNQRDKLKELECPHCGITTFRSYDRYNFCGWCVILGVSMEEKHESINAQIEIYLFLKGEGLAQDQIIRVMEDLYASISLHEALRRIWRFNRLTEFKGLYKEEG